MTTHHLRRAGLAAAAFSAALLLLGTATACAQERRPEQSRATNAARAQQGLSVDSVLARADRSRHKGDATAQVTLVEVSDFQCPYCRQFAEDTYRQLDSVYIRTGRVRLIFLNYPIPNHHEAFAASEAALCAGVQGKFWPMHDRLFATQREWSGQAGAAQRFEGFAREAGVNMEEWRACTEGDQVAPIIVNDVMQASGAGVNGTPTFFLGQRAFTGAVSFQELSREIEAALSAIPQGPRVQPEQPQ